MVLFEECRELHRVIARLNSLHPTIQSPVAGEEIRVGAFYWVERGTLLVALALPLLGIPTKGTGKGPSPTIPELFLLTGRQRRSNYFNVLSCDSH